MGPLVLPRGIEPLYGNFSLASQTSACPLGYGRLVVAVGIEPTLDFRQPAYQAGTLPVSDATVLSLFDCQTDRVAPAKANPRGLLGLTGVPIRKMREFMCG